MVTRPPALTPSSFPDGRRQIVNYYVNGYSGYVADVKYEGDYKPSTYKAASYEPTYKAAAVY